MNFITKRAAILAALFTISAGAFAQDVRFGLKGGINIAQNTIVNTRSLTGFNAGGLVDIGFKKFAIRSGVSYTTKGYKIGGIIIDPNPSPTSNLTSLNVRFGYIEIPVNLLYRGAVSSKVSLYGGFGPYYGFWLNTHATVGNEIYPYKPKKQNDYGLNILGGAEVAKHALVEVGYGYGLAENQKHRVLSFSVGYLF